MSDSQKQHIDNAERTQTIRIELPLGAFSGVRRMMAGFMQAAGSEAGCCEPTINRCCSQSDEGDRYELTVKIERKE